jgi:subtilisin family serine protease
VDELPAWGLASAGGEAVPIAGAWPVSLDASWAWGGSDGTGVRVAVVDSGIDEHPRVGRVQCSAVARRDPATGEAVVEDVAAGDVSGHGTACAGIIRSIAPGCELTSVRVLGPEGRGGGSLLLAGLEWAVEAGHRVVNLSLSSTRPSVVEELRRIADAAYHRGCTLVCAAHNMPVESYPWRFAAVVSVASHTGRDPEELHVNPTPPVEFYAPGVDLDLAWAEGGTMRATGNSFAAPHVAGLVARLLAKHPQLTPAEVKTVLRMAAANVARAA